jgi:hypothetical protein
MLRQIADLVQSAASTAHLDPHPDEYVLVALSSFVTPNVAIAVCLHGTYPGAPTHLSVGRNISGNYLRVSFGKKFDQASRVVQCVNRVPIMSRPKSIFEPAGHTCVRKYLFESHTLLMTAIATFCELETRKSNPKVLLTCPSLHAVSE